MKSQRIRVLFFTPTLGAGGAEMQVLRLLRHLDRTLFEPSLAVARVGGSYEQWLPADVRAEPCTSGVKSSLFSSALSVLPLRRRIDRERPDIVVSLIEHASVALSAAVVGLSRRPRVVLGIQNNLELGIADLSKRQRFMLEPLFVDAYRRADHIVSLSNGVAQALNARIPQTRGKTTVVYNAGTDDHLADLARAPLARPHPGRPLIVACGRLRPQKDFATLLRAVAAMKQTNAELWILGEGALREQLEALATQLGIAERVKWLGFQSNPFPYLAAGDVFALSSRWEGFANVLVEALACGTPVVSTDCPYGPGEILDGGRYGRLVEVGDFGALAAALDAALLEGKSEAHSARCRERASAFDARSSAAGYAAVFRDIAGASRAA